MTIVNYCYFDNGHGGGGCCLLLLGHGRAEGLGPPSGSQGTSSLAVPPRHHPLSTAATEAAVRGCGREIASLWKLQVEKTKTREQHTDVAALRLRGVRAWGRPAGEVPGLGHQHRPRLDSGTRRDACVRVPSCVADLHGPAWLLHGFCSLPLVLDARVSVCSPGWPRTQTSPCFCLCSPGSLSALLPGSSVQRGVPKTTSAVGPPPWAAPARLRTQGPLCAPRPH